MYKISGFVYIHLFMLLSCYDIIIERVENPYVDPNFGSANMTLVKYNRTTNVLNGYWLMLKDAPLDIQLTIELYGMYSNEYRLLPIHITRTFCEFLKFEMQFIINEMHGHIPTDCPIKKGLYYMHNFTMNSAKFPPNVFRTDRFRFDLIFILNKKLLCSLGVYILIDQDIEFRRGFPKLSAAK